MGRGGAGRVWLHGAHLPDPRTAERRGRLALPGREGRAQLPARRPRRERQGRSVQPALDRARPRAHRARRAQRRGRGGQPAGPGGQAGRRDRLLGPRAERSDAGRPQAAHAGSLPYRRLQLPEGAGLPAGRIQHAARPARAGRQGHGLPARERRRDRQHEGVAAGGHPSRLHRVRPDAAEQPLRRDRRVLLHARVVRPLPEELDHG